MWKLEFENDVHEPVELHEGILRIGRDQSNDVVLDEDGISGFHSEVGIDQGTVFLIDLGSTNGTRVNG